MGYIFALPCPVCQLEFNALLLGSDEIDAARTSTLSVVMYIL